MSVRAGMGMDDVLDVLESSTDGPRPVIDMCRGGSRFDPRPYLPPELNGTPLEVQNYCNSLGRPMLRAGISTLINELYGIDLSPEQICVTDGGTGALVTAMLALLQAGDEVILPSVAYPLYAALAKMVGAHVRYAPLRPDGVYDFEWLERTIGPATKCIVINTPCNPRGTIWPKHELERLAGYGIPILSDEVYGLLGHAGLAPSASQVSRQFMVVGSFSKAFALPGIRIGYIAMSREYITRVKAVKRHLNITTSVLSQMFAERVMPIAPGLIEAHRSFLADRRAAFERVLRTRRIATPSKAGYFGLVDVSAIDAPSSTIAIELARRFSVGVAPGTDFATTASHGGGADAITGGRFLRLNFTVPEPDLLLGAARIEAFLDELHHGTLDLAARGPAGARQ